MKLHSNKIWAAASLKPNQIHKAEVNLQRQEIDFLAPKLMVTKRQQNRFINKINLLFPGYIFVHIDLKTDDQRRVQSTYGISRILKVGGQIGKLPENFIEALKSENLVTPQTYTEGLKIEDNVEIIRGPFAGRVARIVKLDSQSRLKCMFNLLEGEINMSIDAENVLVSL